LRHLSVRSFYNKIDPLAENFFDVKILSNRFVSGIEKIIRVYLTPTVFLIIKRVNYDELVKSLILLDVAHKRLFTKPSNYNGAKK